MFNKLIDKDTGTITKESLQYALYSNDIKTPKDDKVIDEMLKFLEKKDDEGEGEEQEVDEEHFNRIFKR